ncbi:MAG: saccharopine dehydrogenase NADP-binding domain-containing protein [Flavobacteriales bacterium]|nr:saccharopine dehydrogenase NADP-binding domain-containing protein [Flavobacteriales bacterium]
MTQKIFIIGAGRSSSSLIKYLIDESIDNNFEIKVGDIDLSLVESKIGANERASAISFDVFNDAQRIVEIQNADIVISMLPATLHFKVAQDCVKYKKNLVTASYVSDEIRSLDVEAKKNGVLLLNEIGLDPGLDHMSAMKVIDDIKAKGGELKSFKSYCGGLVAPEFDTNPWKYKFTWNPRNVVLAGQGTAKYVEGGKYKYIPYGQLFKRTDVLSVLDYGEFEAYANRDSLSYREIYHLDDIPTLFRGTLRRPGYVEAWDLFVQMGMTDDSFEMNVSGMTYNEFFHSFLDDTKFSAKDYLKSHFGVSDIVLFKVEWLGFFKETEIGLEMATPAQVLQKLLETKWLLEEEDKDMIVMQHQFIYELEGAKHELHSSFVTLGEDQTYTGMAKTVGLPVGVATKLILNGVIKGAGVKVPVSKDIYNPVLAELEQFGIEFIEEEIR